MKIDYKKIIKYMNEFAKAHPELERDVEEFKIICMMFATARLAMEDANEKGC